MDFLDPRKAFKGVFTVSQALKRGKGGSEWSNMLFQAEKRTILVILAWGRPKMASGRVKRLRNAFGRPKMTLETEKHLENDLFGLKKHPKNTPVLKGDFGSF